MAATATTEQHEEQLMTTAVRATAGNQKNQLPTTEPRNNYFGADARGYAR
jgi:hypothetical protein